MGFALVIKVFVYYMRYKRTVWLAPFRALCMFGIWEIENAEKVAE